MMEFKKGDRVRIHTKFGGAYDGQIGTVRHKTTTIQPLVNKDNTGFLRYSAIFEGCYDVEFDHRVDIGDHTMVSWDMFYPNELEKMEE